MNDASDNMKAGLFSLLADLGIRSPYLSRDAVRRALDGRPQARKPALLRE